jgi:hypothetical protein
LSRVGPSKTAVCVLRVESRGEAGILITVTTTPDVDVKKPGRTQIVTRPDDALALVGSFLRGYECGQDAGDGGS